MQPFFKGEKSLCYNSKAKTGKAQKTSDKSQWVHCFENGKTNGVRIYHGQKDIPASIEAIEQAAFDAGFNEKVEIAPNLTRHYKVMDHGYKFSYWRAARNCLSQHGTLPTGWSVVLSLE